VDAAESCSEIDAEAPQAWFECNNLALLPLFLDPARSVLPNYQTVAEPGHDRAVTRARIGHLGTYLFDARALTCSTLLGRQWHAVIPFSDFLDCVAAWPHWLR
jgi:hypothetical protein